MTDQHGVTELWCLKQPNGKLVAAGAHIHRQCVKDLAVDLFWVPGGSWKDIHAMGWRIVRARLVEK